MSAGACPICERPASGGYRPFCSKRCAEVDLQRWFSGRYAIPVEDPADDEPEAAGQVAGRPEDDLL